MLLNYDSYIAFLQDELSRRMRVNPRYSQRAFSKQLGLSPGELSEILTGKRPLSLKSVLKISQSLGLNQTEIKHLTYLVQLERSKGLGDLAILKSGKELLSELPKTNQISQDYFQIIADWYHFAILNLAECENFKWHERAIARRLGITKNEALLALKRLEKVGLITKQKGKYAVTKDYVQTTEGIPSEAIRKYHSQILELAKQALELQNVSEREMVGISFPVNMRTIPSIKKDINDFLDQMMAKYSRDKSKREVYQMEIALFRLSKGGADA